MPQHNRPLVQRSSAIRLNALSKTPQPSLSWRWRAGQLGGHLQQGLSPGPCPQAAPGDLSWKLFHTTAVSSVLAELSCTSRFCPNMWTPLREPMTENGSWGKIGNLRQEPPSFLLLENQLLRPPAPFLSLEPLAPPLQGTRITGQLHLQRSKYNSETPPASTPLRTQSPPKSLLFQRSRRPGSHLLAGGGATAAAPAKQGDPARCREAQKMYRALGPLLPHPERSPPSPLVGRVNARLGARP